MKENFEDVGDFMKERVIDLAYGAFYVALPLLLGLAIMFVIIAMLNSAKVDTLATFWIMLGGMAMILVFVGNFLRNNLKGKED
jgi:hypothetical protein